MNKENGIINQNELLLPKILKENSCSLKFQNSVWNIPKINCKIFPLRREDMLKKLQIPTPHDLSCFSFTQNKLHYQIFFH